MSASRGWSSTADSVRRGSTTSTSTEPGTPAGGATFVVNDDPWSEDASTTAVLDDVRRFRSLPGGAVEVVTRSRDFLVVDTRSGEVSAPVLTDIAHATRDPSSRHVVWRGGDPEQCDLVPIHLRDLDAQADIELTMGSSCSEAYAIGEDLIYLGDAAVLWMPELQVASLPGEPLSAMPLDDGALLVRHLDGDGERLTWVQARTGEQVSLLEAEDLTLLHVDPGGQSADVVASERPTRTRGPLWRVFFDGRPKELLLDGIEITAARLEDGRYLSISPDDNSNARNLVRVHRADVAESAPELIDAGAAGELSELAGFDPFPGAHPYLVTESDRSGVWIVAFDDGDTQAHQEFPDARR